MDFYFQLGLDFDQYTVIIIVNVKALALVVL